VKTLFRKIVVSQYGAAVVQPKKARRAEQLGVIAQAKIRQRWSAAYLEGEMVRESVDGFLSFDEAIGALIRKMAQACKSANDVLDLIASLFSDLAVDTTDIALSRAVWIASRRKKRKHPGISVVFPPDVQFFGECKAALTTSASKGGAA
jgi:hypothetical protein